MPQILNNKALYFVILGEFAAIIFLANVKRTPRPSVKSSYRIIREKGTHYTFTNPIVSIQDSDGADKKMSQNIRGYLSNLGQNSGNIKTAVYYKDLNDNTSAGYNQDDTFIPASLIKLPMLIGYLEYAGQNSGFLSQQVTVPGNDYNKLENISPSSTIEPGKSYTIKDLLEAMIISSDNNALENLYQMHPELLKKTFSEDDITLPDSIEKIAMGNYVSPKMYSNFLETLYNASDLGAENSEYALKLLSRIDYNQGLTARLPQQVEVAHKFGERKIEENGQITEQQFHECGIVYYPGHPYVLCVMTKGQDLKTQQDRVAEISKDIYDIVKKDGK